MVESPKQKDIELEIDLAVQNMATDREDDLIEVLD